MNPSGRLATEPFGHVKGCGDLDQGESPQISNDEIYG